MVGRNGLGNVVLPVSLGTSVFHRAILARAICQDPSTYPPALHFPFFPVTLFLLYCSPPPPPPPSLSPSLSRLCFVQEGRSYLLIIHCRTVNRGVFLGEGGGRIERIKEHLRTLYFCFKEWLGSFVATLLISLTVQVSSCEMRRLEVTQTSESLTALVLTGYGATTFSTI